jgi:transcription elongation factor GreA
MAENETILTVNGLKKLEDELEYLRGKKRQEVAERLKVAISYGDISENSEYDDAKDEQAFVEGRILQLDKMIRTAKVIDDSELSKDIVTIGATVELEDMEFGDKEVYTVVGTTEADPTANKISNESPVGSAILGKAVGEVVTVKVNRNEFDYRIVEIK